MHSNNFIYKALLALAGLLWNSAPLSAQQSADARLDSYVMADGSLIRGLSDNGKWAVAYGVNDATSSYHFGKLVNIAANMVTELLSEDEKLSVAENEANDVTDDGTLVVGSYNGSPAVWRKATKAWATVATPSSNLTNGHITAVTPDGKYGIGACSSSMFEEIPVMWDLTTNTIMELNGLPDVDLTGTYQNLTRLTGISADGRYIVGCVSYIYPQEVMYFLYDRQEETWDPVGFTYDSESHTFTPKVDDILTLNSICISSNGEWVAGTVYNSSDIIYPFRYNTTTKAFEAFNAAESQDRGCVSIDNQGTLYAASPAMSPSRTLYVLHGNYWYGLDEILKQCHNIDFYSATGYDMTGFPEGVSGDGTTLVANAYISQENYAVVLPESFGETCERVDLLSDYTVSPRTGTAISKISNIELKFTRNVKTLCNASSLSVKDSKGNVVKTAFSFATSSANPKVVNITFKVFTLEKGETYTLEVPEGAIAIDGDEARINKAFTVSYTGYGTDPLAVVSIAPEDQSTVGHLSMTTNPIVVSFDTDVKLVDGAKAELYRNDETDPICDLNILNGKTESTYKQVMIYPTETQNLFKGNTYRVVIPASQVSDLSGTCFNEELTFGYTGSYERTIVSDDSHIYIENFVGGMGNVMLYEGDKLTPTTAMQDWKFNANTTPWLYAADDDLSNPCAASHSMYSPAGKSDDWMVTPQLTIPDDRCYLSFKAQSYLSSKTDVLKVILLATDEVFNDLTADIIDKFRTEGITLLDETLTPGTSEGSLDGDWTSYTAKLDAYAGKKIYIAFLNENEDQSAMFVAEVNVVHDAAMQIALTGVPESVLRATEQDIKGTVTIQDESETYSAISIQLIDAGQNVIDEISEDGLSLTSGSTYDFAFSRPLPLAIGTENPFVVKAALDNGKRVTTLTTGINNLAFKPNKRVILEEMTGQGCQNCPLGHLAIEKLEDIYEDRFIPLSYHTYTGDSFESGMTDYSQYFLGLAAAPTARIQRGDIISSPMVSYDSNGVRDYTFYSNEHDCWVELVSEEMSKECEADLNISATYSAVTDRITVPFSCKFALSKSNANIGLFCIITEDGLVGFQSNNLYQQTDEDLGEWKSGGIYGSPVVYPYTFNDVARAIYPSNNYYGSIGLLPTSINCDEEYTGTITMSLNTDAPNVSNVDNCKVTLVMIDANTGKVINAARAAINGGTGIDDIHADNGRTLIMGKDGNIVINTEGKANVTVTSVDGRVIATQSVDGSAIVPVSHKGIAIVSVDKGNGRIVKKIAID